MKQITLSLILYLLLGLSFAFGQEKWTTHFENEKVKIEYRIADCSDRVNDISFSYYLLRFENKTKSQLNVQFESSEVNNKLQKQISDEYFNSFILKPSEVREGNCSSMQKELKQFYKKNKSDKENTIQKTVLILNIKTYEL